MTRPYRITPYLLLAILLGAGCAGSEVGSDQRPTVRYIEPDAETGMSMATVVGDVPLVHTEQFFALDPSGNLTGRGDLQGQVGRVLENIRTALGLAHAGFGDVAKLNVYLAEDALRDQVLDLLSRSLPEDARPAVSFVSTEMPHPDALVAMDAVAVSPRTDQTGGVAFFRSDALYGGTGQAHAGILPAGRKVYLSGQAARGDLLEAVGQTMEGLHATLAYLGLSAEDVVQVKAFVNTVSEAEAIEEKIEEYYRLKPAPPIVVTEWRQESFPAEIELIASRGRTGTSADAGDPISYITQPGASSSSVFSRIAEVHRGSLVYVSGLYGTPGQDDRAQVQEVFDTLGRVLGEAGSDFNHMVKATYYHSTGEASSAINEIRRALYDPERPPAASKISVGSVGKENTTVTLDMIAVIPE